jgi:hypothetical protein
MLGSNLLRASDIGWPRPGRARPMLQMLGRLAVAAIALLCIIAPLRAAPVGNHPRLWINSTDVPRLRSWAMNTNPMFQYGLSAAASTAKAHADVCFNDATLQPRSCWRDTGSISWEGR